MRIHSTIILDDTELTIEGDERATEGGEFVMLRSHVKADRTRPIAEAQLTALRRARELIAAEMKAIEDMKDRD